MPYAELLFISAKTGQRLPKLFETIDMVLQYQNLRVQTGVLNEILTEAMAITAAAVRPWKTTENLLHDTGFRSNRRHLLFSSTTKN